MLDSGEKHYVAHTLKKMKAKTTFNLFEAI